MNLCVFTGWIQMEPERRIRADLREVICFRLITKSKSGEEQLLFFRLDDKAILTRCREFLTVGRGLVVESEALRVPVERHGVHSTDRITFQVLGLEIPNRSKAEPDESTTKNTKDTKVESAA